MKNEFKKILSLLEKINQISPNKTSSFEELKKEAQRIEDLEQLDKKSVNHLNLLKKSYNSPIDEIMKHICHLNVYLGTYVWHIESMRDITEKSTLKDSKND
jgi:hypothetical protein